MSRLWLISFTLLGLFMPLTTSAAVLHAIVEMENLTVIKQTTKGGNQIYINLFESCINPSQKNQTCTNAVPQLHWQFLKEDTAKKVWLWQGKLDEGDTAKIVFIVNEKALNPFKSSELIGAMTLQLANDHGILQTRWSSGEETTAVPIDPTASKFRLAGNGGSFGIYEITLRAILA